MGLEYFDVAPDNRGGREKKTDDEDDKRRIKGAFTLEDDTEEYWKQQYTKVIGVRKPTEDDITELADKLHILPRTVKKKFTKYGVHEYEGFVDEEESSGLHSIVQNAK